MTCLSSRRGLAQLASAVCAALPAAVLGGPTWLSGTSTITHTGNIGGSPATRVVGPFTPPNFTALSYVIPLQYSLVPPAIVGTGGATSHGRGGIGAVSQPSYFGLEFAKSTTLTQSGNTNTSPATASTLRIDFTSRWRIDGVPFGPTTMCGATFSVVANVPNNPGVAFTELTVSATFKRYDAFGFFIADLRPPILPAPPLFYKETSGSQIATVSNLVAATPISIPVGNQVEISGYLQFRVHNMPDADISLRDEPGVFPSVSIFVREDPQTFGTLPVQTECASMPTPPLDLPYGPGLEPFIPIDVTGTGATVVNQTYLDITATPSMFGPPAPTQLALYNAAGQLLHVDSFDGFNGNFGQLTFGHGRRPALPGAVDLDGRDGDLPPGRYYLGVADPGSTFLPGFDLMASGAGGRAEINIHHNVGSLGNCPLPPPVAPFAIDLGALINGSPIVGTLTAGPRQVGWLKFRLPCGISPSNSQFLDLGFPITPEGELYSVALFDVTGALAGFAQNIGPPGNQAQLSFGASAAPRPPIGPGGAPFAGQSGSTLPAGDYYLAIMRRPGQFAPPFWQVRAPNIPINNGLLSLSHGGGPCPAVCAVDFNNDGFLNQEDLTGYLNAFLDESIPPGPSGTSTAPCPGAPPPYDTLGYAADYNRDCNFDQEDLSGFLTEYFAESENPMHCIPG